jgi:peptide/nickel transport system substrate-binding protein
MKRRVRAVVIVGMLVAVSCTGGGDEEPSPSGPGSETGTGGTPSATGGDLHGGTLRVATLIDFSAAMDPQKEYTEWGFFRCCLLRTLLAYPGLPAGEGGAQLKPDLATDFPEVSSDGLTWMFGLKPGVRYAPPYEDTTIVAQDFIRALERLADPKASAGGYSFYYSIIEGFDAFSAGDVDSIAGLSAPDQQTLVVQLTRPSGDLPFLFAMPATAPLPEGAADGHTEDYGRFLIASGPYMVEGAPDMDPNLPPAEQVPASGFVPGQSLVLMRNPSWDASTDEIRPAYVDRIEVTFGGNPEDIAQKVEVGEVDLFMHGPPPAGAIQRFATSAELKDQLHVTPGDRILYISINVAEPPFDDLHVRKAVNLVIDKQGLRQLAGGPAIGEISGHVIPDGIIGNLIAGFDPYATSDGAGDVSVAQEEMRQSVYDKDGDGVCDDPVCKGVLALTATDDPFPKQAALITDNLAQLGIELRVRALNIGAMFGQCNDPFAHMGLCLGAGWGKDYPDGASYGTPLFGSSGIGPDGCCNNSLVGAGADLLAEAGYGSVDVPTVDPLIEECAPLAGQERLQCWADFDRTLMEEVVPIVPYLVSNQVEIVSARVVRYQFDSFSNGAALESVAVQE